MFEEYLTADVILTGIATYCAILLKDIRDLIKKKIDDDWKRKMDEEWKAPIV